MKLEEFNPANVELDVNGTILTFKNFSLLEKAWAINAFKSEKEPNGLVNLGKGLEALDAVTIARLAWRLIKNKSDMPIDNFFSYAENSRNLIEVLKAVSEVLANSQPTSKTNERMRELKKS